MSGNVWEWTNSLYDPTYTLRVFRGGSWSTFSSSAAVTLRGSSSPYYYFNGIGFRLVRAF